MNGRLAKLIRAEVAPREKLKSLRDTRVSRGEFFRETTTGKWGQVMKSTLNPARIRMIYKRDEEGNLTEEVVRATHSLQYRLGECPRTAYQIIKRRVKCLQA